MASRHSDQQQVVDYYETFESRVVYALLGGIKHFGYYPEEVKRLTIRQAQVRMMDRLADALALRPGDRVLDAGCGEGGTSLRLALLHQVQVDGVDLVPTSVRRACRQAVRLGLEGRVRFQVADYTALDFADASFDAVYTMETLVHAPDPLAALRELNRVLKPGGRLALIEYSLSASEDLTPSQQAMAELIARESGMHSLLRFRHGTLPGMLVQAGFEHVRVEDITARMLPMLRIMYRWAAVPYALVRALHLEWRFINTTAIVECYRNTVRYGVGRYNVITARKPDHSEIGTPYLKETNHEPRHLQGSSAGRGPGPGCHQGASGRRFAGP